MPPENGRAPLPPGGGRANDPSTWLSREDALTPTPEGVGVGRWFAHEHEHHAEAAARSGS